MGIFEEAEQIMAPLTREKVLDFALAVAVRLKDVYKDKYPYWCLHCGPQITVYKVD